jgi:hypothetical protein
MLQYGRLSRSQAARQKAWLNVARLPLTRFARAVWFGRVVVIVALCFAGGCYGSLRPQQSRAGSIEQTRQQPLTETARAAAAMPHRRTGYPLLASYNGFALAADVPAYAYYNLVIASQDANVGAPSPLALLRLANPTLIALLYQRTLQVDYPLIQQYYGTSTLYPGWWLLRAGSVLKTRINATQRWIPVQDPSRFQIDDDVLVDGETMHVVDKYGVALIVQRGFYSQAVAHTAGARIAAHYSYRVDLKNSVISGPGENRRPWSLNLSTLCPHDRQGRTWDDFLAEYLRNQLHAGNWSGIFLDNTDETVRDPTVDVNNDNQPDGGMVGGVNVWSAGELALMAELRRLVPDVLILDNGTLVTGAASNGREFENFALSGPAYLAAMQDYALWPQRVAPPDLLLINPDTQRHPHYDLRAMRFGLASALLGDGLYVYDEGWHHHGAAWMFDEYDNGAGTALLHDTSGTATYLAVRSTAKFRVGDVLIVGREQMRVASLGPRGLNVVRGIGGTVAVSHPAHTVVATAAQIAAGTGYLGQPLGAAHVMGSANAPGTFAPAVLTRAFQRGLVLVNQTARVQVVVLPHLYRHLNGDQDPSINDGRSVRVVRLQPYTGLILLDIPPA